MAINLQTFSPFICSHDIIHNPTLYPSSQSFFTSLRSCFIFLPTSIIDHPFAIFFSPFLHFFFRSLHFSTPPNGTTMDVIKAHRPAQSPEKDSSTLSNYDHFKLNCTSLDFDVDFDTQIVSGVVHHDITVVKPTTTLALDVSYLDIKSVTVNGTKTDFTESDRIGTLGSRLSFAIPEESHLDIVINYATTKNCTALQFLDKEATDGKVAPYLFCQCEAIHARSLFPCFDTPAVKAPYKLTAKSPYYTLLSGRPVEVEGPVYVYDQPIPIPSYLISIASGDLVRANIGPRSDVFSEPVNIKKCQWEFEHDMENFIQIAEALIFHYEWERFDSLVLPASFPYGGMEIPNLCQLTPTLISEDRSQVGVMAHELAHSWSGNLVTNCSWEHFWLNEGWTVYIERRILEGIAVQEQLRLGKSKEEAEKYGESYRHFSAIIGWSDLENSIKAMGDSAKKFSNLVQNLKNREDPDDAFSTVPYEKGFNLLFHIEKLVGGKKVFDKFIPHYFETFKYGSLDTYQFIDTLYAFFPDKHAALDLIDWESWLYKPGMPPVDPHFDTTLADQCYKLADKWYDSLTGRRGEDFSAKDIAGFEANQSVVFLDTLIGFEKRDGFSWSDHPAALVHMESVYKTYPSTKNAEILSRWYLLQASGKRMDVVHKFGEWLGTIGRMKFVRPGYLLINKIDHELAVHFFNKFETRYHPICKALVKKDLGI